MPHYTFHHFLRRRSLTLRKSFRPFHIYYKHAHSTMKAVMHRQIIQYGKSANSCRFRAGYAFNVDTGNYRKNVVK